MNGLEKQTATLLRQMGLPYAPQFHPGERIAPVDFYLRGLKRIVEVDGCYYHGCKKCGCPDRFNRAEADAEKVKRLEALGYKVLRLKECEMKNGSAEKMIKGWLITGALERVGEKIGERAAELAAAAVVAGAGAAVVKAYQWVSGKRNGKPAPGKTDEPPSGPAPQGCGPFD